MRLSAGLVLAVVATLCLSAAAQAQSARLTAWNLKLGQPVAEQPPWLAFRGYACGGNGGPPRQVIGGFGDFARCRAEASGLHEVYFEYDDEQEYIARAREWIAQIPRNAGTTEQGYPVIVSALFDSRGVLAGLRMVSDPRPDSRPEIQPSEVRTRREAHALAAIFAARFSVDANEHCRQLPLGPGEAPVDDGYIKRQCERVDERLSRRVVLHVHHFRKSGQTGFERDDPTQPTQGQFESLTRFELHAVARPAAR
jgi:hypothetical protein